MDSVRKQTKDFFRNTAQNGLEIRQGQVEMADEVCTAFEKHLPLAVEAEVGIGKSFAYLVPAVLKFAQDHKQIVIATSTIALQEQLNRDAHNVLKMLGVNIDIVVAKGMKNYICKRRLNGFVSRNKQDFIAQKLFNIVQNGSQDIAKINVKIPDKILKKITIRNFGDGYCNVCESTMSCEYSAIRKQIASGNNIVICNQNMFISHRINSNRSQGIFNENCSIYIIDEAHNLESKFRDAFSVSCSRKDLINKINGCSKIASSEKSKFTKRLTGGMCETVQKLYTELNRQVHQQQKAMDDGASAFSFKRTKEVLINANELHRKIERFETFTEVSVPDVKRFIEEIISPDRNKIMWIENGENIRLCICKKDISRDISKLLFGKSNVILTSATISYRQDGTPMEKCEYFLNNIHFPTSGIVSEPKKSPFDYESNTMIYVSQNMPLPKHNEKEEYREKSIVEIVQLLEITQGKTLILFTSKSDMEFVYRKLSNMNLPYKILIQSGGSSQAYQLKRFKNDVNSVILGSGTYWEGINIEGESLSQVIIYKLPFPYPDPIISCKMAGTDDPLMEIAVPEMIIKLRQGIGRLIRSESDKGIVSILDSRLSSVSKSRYKKIVFDAIPIKRKTEDMAVISDFWNKLNGGQNEKIRTGRPDDFSCQPIHFGADERCSGKSEKADRGKMSE